MSSRSWFESIEVLFTIKYTSLGRGVFYIFFTSRCISIELPNIDLNLAEREREREREMTQYHITVSMGKKFFFQKFSSRIQMEFQTKTPRNQIRLYNVIMGHVWIFLLVTIILNWSIYSCSRSHCVFDANHLTQKSNNKWNFQLSNREMP